MNVPVSRTLFQTIDAKVTPIAANGRNSFRNRDSQGILKCATATRHMSTLRTCPPRGITPGPPTQKLRPFIQMAATLAAIEILKVFEAWDDDKPYENPTNVSVSRNHY